MDSIYYVLCDLSRPGMFALSALIGWLVVVYEYRFLKEKTNELLNVFPPTHQEEKKREGRSMDGKQMEYIDNFQLLVKLKQVGREGRTFCAEREPCFCVFVTIYILWFCSIEGGASE